MAGIQFPNNALGPGTITALVKDNNGDPNTVLEASLNFTIDAEW
jgi:hypothetical protein